MAHHTFSVCLPTQYYQNYENTLKTPGTWPLALLSTLKKWPIAVEFFELPECFVFAAFEVQVGLEHPPSCQDDLNAVSFCCETFGGVERVENDMSQHLNVPTKSKVKSGLELFYIFSLLGQTLKIVTCLKLARPLRTLVFFQAPPIKK